MGGNETIKIEFVVSSSGKVAIVHYCACMGCCFSDCEFEVCDP